MKFNAKPVQTGELLVGAGIGFEFTVTLVVIVAVQVATEVTVNVYTPLMVVVAVPIVGEFVNVYTDSDEPDDTDVPPEFVAVTVNVYGVLGVNPDTVIGEDVPVPVKPPGLLVTV